MKKKMLTVMLTLTLLVWNVPAIGVYAVSDPGEGPTAAEYAPDRVLVLYEDGAVDTENPKTAAGRKSLSQAASEHRAKSFGSSSASLGKEAVREAENSLGQQASILDKSLKDDYTIEDTVVFEADGREPDMVISTVSSDSMDVQQLAERLSKNDKIRIAEPDYVVHTADVDWNSWNDPYMGDMHHLTGENSIHADALWESDQYKEQAEAAESTEDKVVVAVLDTGINYTHPDLANRMWHKPSSREFSQFFGKYGYDFANDDYDPMDDNNHGTHCAGIIAAETNNAKAEGMLGVAGVSDKIELMAVKALDASGSGFTSNLIAGIRYTIAMKKAGANVRALNGSFGGNGDSRLFEEVLKEAGEAGILTLVAAGNSAGDNDVDTVAPANTDSDYRVTVAASDENGEIASYSCYGQRSVDVVAPGSNILSTVALDNYAPYLYDADTLSENTAYYGEFDGAIVKKENEEIVSVQPVTGNDYKGDAIGDRVGSFKPSVMRSNKVEGSNGKATLEITEDMPFPVGNNKKHLRWKIQNAEKGDSYILFFPYDKEPGDYSSTYTNIAFRSHMTKGSGKASISDVLIHGVDTKGRADWKDTSSQNNGSCVRSISRISNSSWRASGKANVLFPYSAIQGAEDYGLGIVYTASSSCDCWFDISSLAIAKRDAAKGTFGKYDVLSGTSMATPVATGTAAILAALEPEMSVTELKDALCSATRPDYEGWCSTGGIIDLREYKATAASRPAVSKVTADFEAGTVRLEGSGFGTAPTVKVKNVAAGAEETIPVNDISMEDGAIVISHAGARTGPDDQVNHGIIGSNVVFAVKNTQNNKSGTKADYVVRGLAAYEDGYTLDCYTDSSRNRKDTELPPAPEFIPCGNDLLLHEGGQRIYRIEKDAETGDYRVKQLGTSIRTAINEYVGKIYADDNRKDSLWHPLDKGKESDFSFYRLTNMSDPVCMNGKVYDLVCANMGYAKAALLLELDLSSQKWSVCYDSLEGFGTAPDNLRWKEIGTTTLAGYNGKLYIFGSVRNDEAYADDKAKPAPMEYTEEDIQTEVFSCEPQENGVDWIQESASLPRARARGVAVNQGGNLYYVLTSKSAQDVDYSVYQFDGQDWSIAGTLPNALSLGLKGGQQVSDGYYTVTYGTYASVPCALGPDNRGILFGGKSFDGAGDTFRFNTTTGKVEPLGYTLWGRASDVPTNGTVAGDKLWVQYYGVLSGYSNVEMTAKTIPITPDPSQPQGSQESQNSGQGQQGQQGQSGQLAAAQEMAAAEAKQTKELSDAKTSALGRLEDFSEVKALPDFSKAEKKAYDQAVAKGQSAIKAAADKDAVDAALKQAKKNVNAALDKIKKDRAEAKAKKVKTVTVNVATVNAKAVDKAVKKAGGKAKYVKIIVIGKNVKKINAKAFTKYEKAKTLQVKTTKLKKKTVKNSLRGSRVTTIKVKVGSKKANKKYVKKYKKIFTAKNAGKKVKLISA